jgi:hypothetical protein
VVGDIFSSSGLSSLVSWILENCCLSVRTRFRTAFFFHESVLGRLLCEL